MAFPASNLQVAFPSAHMHTLSTRRKSIQRSGCLPELCERPTIVLAAPQEPYSDAPWRTRFQNPFEAEVDGGVTAVRASIVTTQQVRNLQCGLHVLDRRVQRRALNCPHCRYLVCWSLHGGGAHAASFASCAHRRLVQLFI